MTVYNTGRRLTDEQKTVAGYWADGPGATGTPPGHWIWITGLMIDKNKLSLGPASEAYALTSVSIADAFIICWREKFHSTLLRPVTYIRALIDPNWQTLIGTPPFPTYFSGHSSGSGAASAVLTDLFGETQFTDTTHVVRGIAARSFPSFAAAAEEAAVSRLYGGIHFPMDNEAGLTAGRCVAKVVKQRVHTRPMTP